MPDAWRGGRVWRASRQPQRPQARHVHQGDEDPEGACPRAHPRDERNAARVREALRSTPRRGRRPSPIPQEGRRVHLQRRARCALALTLGLRVDNALRVLVDSHLSQAFGRRVGAVHQFNLGHIDVALMVGEYVAWGDNEARDSGECAEVLLHFTFQSRLLPGLKSSEPRACRRTADGIDRRLHQGSS
jgi:hypothetical protein